MRSSLHTASRGEKRRAVPEPEPEPEPEPVPVPMTCLRCAPGPKSAPFRIGTRALAIKTSVTGKAARHPDLSDKPSTDCQAARRRCSSKKACDAMPWMASNCLWEASRGSSVLRRLCRVPVVGRSCLGRCRPAAGGSNEGTDAKRRHVCDAPPPPPQRTHLHHTPCSPLVISSHLDFLSRGSRPSHHSDIIIHLFLAQVNWPYLFPSLANLPLPRSNAS
ncbi:hypothetical protein IWX48DRAFT_122145 [Phyllosticta citricarpa]